MMDENLTQRLHAVIEGRVQGVGFRAFVLEKASILGLSGWVRNTVQGNVECTAEGDRAQLELLVEYLRHGPRSAFVSDLNLRWEASTGEFEDFRVRSTFS
jgi:acylphosphatase